jgi:ribosomal protein S12 methylthiotransferase
VDGPAIRTLIARLRERWPNVVLRTTFIAGFPGETDEQFEELLAYLGEAKFERAGVFAYSREPGTPADRLDGHLPEEVKEERRQRLMLAQQEVAFAHAQRQIGQRTTVVVDAVKHEEAGPVLVCRSTGDAPDIDTQLTIPGDAAEPGQFLKARVVAADGYDLVAEPVGLPW